MRSGPVRPAPARRASPSRRSPETGDFRLADARLAPRRGARPCAEQLRLLETLPGIDRTSACAILSETGADPHRVFGNAQRLASPVEPQRPRTRPPPPSLVTPFRHPRRGVSASPGEFRGMQRKKQQEKRAPQSLAPPSPDPWHLEAVLDTVPRAAGIDVHKMSLTCTVPVEDDNGRVTSETRQYRTHGAELGLPVDWLAGLDLARVVMESTGVFWKSVQRT